LIYEITELVEDTTCIRGEEVDSPISLTKSVPTYNCNPFNPKVSFLSVTQPVNENQDNED